MANNILIDVPAAKVCRICLIEVEEDAKDTLRMDCNCQGELGLAHQECIVKWVWQWQDVLALAAVNMLAYFCFLFRLLINEMGHGARAMSVAFSCILGILAAFTSTTIMVRRRYAWIYATAEFILVIHMTWIVSVLLAKFAGFGGAICGIYIGYKFLKRSESQLRETADIEQPQEPSHQRGSLEGTREVLLAKFAGFGGAICGIYIGYKFLKWRESQLRENADIEQPQEPSHQRRSLEGTREGTCPPRA
ncbi:hypothetical protein CTI12_AA571450 [Artemisia annua]|uniref:RING-CH-type domain-containing protein n=1 Tax=Artemisia annua TaxID=35608 RepID=A0A2U1KRZ6_ARTAN|nr:hypothetical protein CTI12_AA571450 [Artemisia annua]